MADTITKPSPESQARERFIRDTADHKMTVLKDDDLYRHLRFQREDGSSFYWFDIVTWPGCLVINGDCGTYTFSRLRDMFEFFGPRGARGGIEDERYGINPHYWSEKLRAPGRDPVRHYSFEVYVRRVTEWMDGQIAYDGLEPDETSALRNAVHEQLLEHSEYDTEPDEHDAHRRLCEFEHNGVHIGDSWEWDLREYDWSFLWCCWAIVWGIGQYRAAKG